ncbi:MAG: pentapeptide repeat-containing protein [Verrucomicrobiae bacterium]|nr:pentapeptide repeat-containing protein [Verrucomicrobiae bacterium]
MTNPDDSKEKTLAEGFFNRHKETATTSIGIAGLIIGIVGLIFGIVQWRSASNIANENTRLASENNKLESSNNVIAALDIVSRYAAELSGTALTQADARISSSDAVTLHAPVFSPAIKNFELDLTAIKGLTALTDILVSGKSNEETGEFINSYIAPILFAKAQSGDPTEATASLIAAAHCFRDKEIRQRAIDSGALGTDFQSGAFLMVDMKNLAPDLSKFDLDRSNWTDSQIKRVKLVGSTARGATFKGSNFLLVDFSSGDFTSASESEPTIFDQATFTDCTSFSGSRFSNGSFRNATFVDCKIQNASFDESVFVGAKNFVGDGEPRLFEVDSSNFYNVDFANAQFKNARFDNSRFEGALFAASVFEKTVFNKCNFTNAEFPMSDLSTVALKECNLVGSDLGTSIISVTTFDNCRLDWARLPSSVSDMFGSIKAKVSLSDDSLAIVVTAITPPPPSGEPKYLLKGVVTTKDGRVYDELGGSAKVFDRLSDLSSQQLEQIGLTPEKKEQESMRAELALRWSLAIP